VPKTEITRDEISLRARGSRLQTAKTDRDCFLKYDFPKSAEESMSKYAEGVRELDKARRVAISQTCAGQGEIKFPRRASMMCNFASARTSTSNSTNAPCGALKSGLVVYCGKQQAMSIMATRNPFAKAPPVRERQSIITIPDMTRMSVNVKIHESYIKKNQEGPGGAHHRGCLPRSAADRHHQPRWVCCRIRRIAG